MDQSPKPLVGIVMGSKSDWETMAHADEMLTRFGVPHECRVLSAHRTPEEAHEYRGQRRVARPGSADRRRRRAPRTWPA